MKKLFLMLLTVMLAGHAWADNFDFSAKCSSGQTLYYIITNDNTNSVQCYGYDYVYGNENKPSGNLVVPEIVTYKDASYSVTSIGDDAFYGCSSLTSVTIPNSVTEIGSEAFYGCSGLTSITIPNSVTSIGHDAFHGCSNLTSVTIPNSVTSIYIGTFYNCSGLTSISIPNSVTSIWDNAFYGCNSLTTVTIPNSITNISSNAFSDCNNLRYNGQNLGF